MMLFPNVDRCGGGGAAAAAAAAAPPPPASVGRCDNGDAFANAVVGTSSPKLEDGMLSQTPLVAYGDAQFAISMKGIMTAIYTAAYLSMKGMIMTPFLCQRHGTSQRRTHHCVSLITELLSLWWSPLQHLQRQSLRETAV